MDWSLRVEGHSDNQPIHTPEFRSNWELSTARAMTVLMLLINDCGLDPGRVSVAGYAQFRPIADNATPDGRQMNRRVDLVGGCTGSRKAACSVGARSFCPSFATRCPN